ncbi:MAG: FG-GAP-like repeat-containing protein, partial [Bacteroidota bacterium]
MSKVFTYLLTLITFIFVTSCVESEQDKEVNQTVQSPIFRKLNAPEMGISFSNNLTETDTLNYFTYPYIYMGGGVAAGDINNDGLHDLFFTGNMVSNKLYLNKGGLEFEDITEKAGLAGDQRWFTGVTMADVNDDGYLDIYCLVAGQSDPTGNLLYINNGDNTFTESSKKYGLHDLGNSVDASFFDYDLDGDLDVYVANYPVTPFLYNSYDYKARMDRVTDIETDNLYRNDGGRFTKVTEQAGVKLYSLTLSVTVSDLNNDGWPDFYNSNDFGSPDCLYINNQDGTFTNQIKATTNHTAFYGMGVDIADFNNDGYMDILQMDMDAASNRRSKSNMASMNPLIAENMQKVGFHHQVMQNVLQLNTGVLQDGAMPKFSDVSRLSGLSSTDWSWAPLFADLDNDGMKDVFISNGTRREINNKDYFANLRGEKKHKDSLLIKSLRIPSEKIDNYAYRNTGDLGFEVANDYWGISHKGFSNGAIYVDLDNDGDLEIVTNNIDEHPSIFENTSSKNNNYLVVSFEGPAGNQSGLGGKVELMNDGTRQVQELTLSRGFQSSVAPELHFGLGNSDSISSLVVRWPDGSIQELNDVAANQKLVVKHQDAVAKLAALPDQMTQLFESFPDDTLALYKHKENRYDDFKDEVLLPHKTSQFGPGIAVGDLNGDGLEDFYVGAAHKYPAGLFYQNTEGSFTQQKFKWLLHDRFHEDEGVVFFDPDKDGDLDIYVVSGGNEFRNQPHLLQDRLYINDGVGNFTRDRTAIPNFIGSGSRVYACDYDRDGDQDLFVGGRLVPGNYPYPADSYLLRNDTQQGQVKFTNVTRSVAPDLYN